MSVATATKSTEPTEIYMFQFTDPVKNSNKYYTYRVWDLGGGQLEVHAEHGRVGHKTVLPVKTLTRRQLDSLLHEREHRKHYKPVQLHKPSLAPTQASVAYGSTDTKVNDLLDFIFAQAGEYIKTYLATTVEALSPDQIRQGQRLLALAQEAKSRRDNAELLRCVTDYYNTIPTELPRKLTPDVLVREFTYSFSEQEERLLQLEAAVATMTGNISAPHQTKMAQLGANISLLSQNDTRYGQIVDYISTTKVHHNQKVNIKDIFEVLIPNERKSFEANQFGISRRELLFHGTHTQNVRHILRTGLICPSTIAHARMFGNGIYFANKVTKSTQYCETRGGNQHVLFIAEVALGNSYVAPGDLSISRAPAGYESVWGKAGYTVARIGRLVYDEWVVYLPAQQTIKFLVTFEK